MLHRNSLIFTTLVVPLLAPPAAQAQVEQVSLRVDGLACPFCAYGLEKKVSKLAGYQPDTYTVKINDGVVSFRWRRDKPLDLAAVERAVDTAGFTLRGVTGRFVGTLAKGHDQYLLRLLAPFDQQFVLREPSKTLGDPMKDRLERMIADGNAVEISGSVRGGHNTDAMDSIGVHDLRVVEPPTVSGDRCVFEVRDLRCGGCVTRVVQAVGALEDVLHVQGKHEDDRVEIWTRSKSPDRDALESQIRSLGFKVHRLETRHQDSH